MSGQHVSRWQSFGGHNPKSGRQVSVTGYQRTDYYAALSDIVRWMDDADEFYFHGSLEERLFDNVRQHAADTGLTLTEEQTRRMQSLLCWHLRIGQRMAERKTLWGCILRVLHVLFGE